MIISTILFLVVVIANKKYELFCEDTATILLSLYGVAFVFEIVFYAIFIAEVIK